MQHKQTNVDTRNQHTCVRANCDDEGAKFASAASHLISSHLISSLAGPVSFLETRPSIANIGRHDFRHHTTSPRANSEAASGRPNARTGSKSKHTYNRIACSMKFLHRVIPWKSRLLKGEYNIICEQGPTHTSSLLEAAQNQPHPAPQKRPPPLNANNTKNNRRTVYHHRYCA